MKHIRPVGPRLLVRLHYKEHQLKADAKKAGLVLPDSVDQRLRDQVMEADVIAVGTQSYTDQFDGTPWCKVGDRVLIAKYGGEEVSEPDDEIKYRLIEDRDVHAVIIEEDIHE